MAIEHFDVVIVGAGLSGIGAACHLRTNCPDKTFAVLEARQSIGGTWDLFRYPGVRSDSDMYTLGYAFKPWTDAKAIADGPSILNYVRETAREYDVERHIRFGHRIVSVSWKTADARWTVEAEHDGTLVQVTCSFLFVCSGYYRYDEGYTPTFAGVENFAGTIVHPQHWPTDLDYRGKRVIVIGSGATAVTLVPSMAKHAGHVTMLQRSPTYVISRPGNDALADALRERLPAKLSYGLVRAKNVLLGMLSYQLSQRRPELMRTIIRKGVEKALPADYDVSVNFNPSYKPWDQRLCLVPDGDLFEAISNGRASIVTDRITNFTKSGVMLQSGVELTADVIVTATGLQLLAFGGMEIRVDGIPIELPKTVGYKGMMLCGVPNLAYAVGYTNASWTLKVDLVSNYICRLLKRMDANGERYCVPSAPDASLPTEPFLNLRSGYIDRSVDAFPKQGAAAPWRLYQNYIRDLVQFKFGRLQDASMKFVR